MHAVGASSGGLIRDSKVDNIIKIPFQIEKSIYNNTRNNIKNIIPLLIFIKKTYSDIFIIFGALHIY